MTSISNNVYIDRLDDIVHEYDNAYHITIKIKPVDVKSSTYIDFNVEKNNIVLKCEVRDYVRISKYKYIFGKGYPPNRSEEVCY